MYYVIFCLNDVFAIVYLSLFGKCVQKEDKKFAFDSNKIDLKKIHMKKYKQWNWIKLINNLIVSF